MLKSPKYIFVTIPKIYFFVTKVQLLERFSCQIPLKKSQLAPNILSVLFFRNQNFSEGSRAQLVVKFQQFAKTSFIICFIFKYQNRI